MNDRRTARLFSLLILVHIGVTAVTLVAYNALWMSSLGSGIYGTPGFRIVAGGIIWKVFALVLIRTGWLQTGVLLYIVSTAVTPLTAPFTASENAEVALLTVAIIPVLLASAVFSARATVLILVAESAVAGVRLANADVMTVTERNTGAAIVLIVAIAGALVVVLRRHWTAQEADGMRHIREGTERYHQLFETIADGIFVVGAARRIVEVNDAACRQLGYTRDELLRMSVDDIVPADQRTDSVTAVALRTGLATVETQHVRKDGTLVPVELTLSPTDLYGAPGFLAVARDISDRLRADASAPG